MPINNNTRGYLDKLKRKADRNVHTTDYGNNLPDYIPESYDVDDAIAEDQFALFFNKEIEHWYIDEDGGTGNIYNQDFYVSMMIGWETKLYQETLIKEFGAKIYGANAYFDIEANALQALSWVVSMKTLAKISGDDVITFEEI